MATVGRGDAVTDTSVLINFLALDRVDLLLDHPRYRFAITNHVKREVKEHYAEEFSRQRCRERSQPTCYIRNTNWVNCIEIDSQGVAL